MTLLKPFLKLEAGKGTVIKEFLYRDLQFEDLKEPGVDI
jgi:hypothetical protein